MKTRVLCSSLKILSIVTIIFLGAINQTAIAQDQTKKTITLSLNEASFSDLADAVKFQTSYKIFYNNKQAKEIEPLTITVKDKDLFSVLKEILQNTTLSYKVISKQIVIIDKDKSSKSANKTVNLTLLVKDSKTNEPLPGAVCQFLALGINGVTNADGLVTIQNIPMGKWDLTASMLGYEIYKKEINVISETPLSIKMVETSLSLNIVHVVATKSEAGQATSSTISRQALDHIQATSLIDILQLLPGNIVGNFDDLTSPVANQFKIRTLASDENNSFGVSIMMDGVPMSNNANMNSGNAFSTTGGGFDLRKIGTDNIESIEVIRGVPSAKYGDLSAGAVIIKSKIGSTPYTARVKVNPSIIQASFGKGWNLGKNKGFLNTSFDYANSSGDPRLKTESFDRINTSLAYSNKFGIWTPKFRVNYSGIVDKQKADPDQVDDGTYTKSKDYTIKITHSGRFNFNSLFSRSLNYNLSTSFGKNDYFTKKIVTNNEHGGIKNSREEGIFEALFLPSSYATSGGTKGEPVSFYGSLSNNFFIKMGKINQRFDMGIQYAYNKNKGEGIYNTDDAMPLKPTSSRPRAFNDIPALNRVSAYLEDNFTLSLEKLTVKLQAGVRYENLQPGKTESVHSFSPRLNMSISPSKYLDLKFAYGKNAKTPGMIHLYPNPQYKDRVIAEYSTGTGTDDYALYQTYISNPDNSNLKNSTNERFEAGFDLKLKNSRRFSVTAYWDEDNNGFGSLSDYKIYTYNHYSVDNGSITVGNDGLPIVDFTKPDRIDTVMTTTGKIGNTKGAKNRGIEFDFELGRINSINTSLYLRGAYMYSKSYSTSNSYSNPTGYSTSNGIAPPLKFVYSSSNLSNELKRFSTSLQAVYNIPQLNMVASAVFQIVLYNYSRDINVAQRPIAYLTNKLEYNTISDEMYEDPDYMIEGFRLQDQVRSSTDTKGYTQPPLWMLNAHLTKNISDFMGISFYVNNMPYYQPWQHSNQSKTETERNTGNFSFGLELNIKL